MFDDFGGAPWRSVGCIVVCRSFLASTAVVVRAGWGWWRHGQDGWREPWSCRACARGASFDCWAGLGLYQVVGVEWGCRLVAGSVVYSVKSSFRLADCAWVPGGRSLWPRMLGGGCRGRVIALSFPVKDSPSAGYPPVRGGQTSQCMTGCALQMTMSLRRMSYGLSSEICKTLLGFGLV